MVQSLPTLGMPSDDNAISLAAAWYANGLGRYIIQQQPEAKKAFTLWKQEGAEGTSLVSQLEQNQELKDVVLNETPWVLDADNETRQKQLLADFFDDNLMQNRLTSVINKLRQLQRSDGSWSWWPGMSGSFYMTVAVSEMLVRLNDLAGVQQESARLLDKAFDFMGKEMVEEVKDLKKLEKEGNEVGFPSYKALQWLYMVALDGMELPSDVNRANDYLLKLLKKDIRNQTMYEKALSAVIFSKFEPKRALEYIQSLKEYTVYREDIGRYYDTQRAGYSWFDYTIPTQSQQCQCCLCLPDGAGESAHRRDGSRPDEDRRSPVGDAEAHGCHRLREDQCARYRQDTHGREDLRRHLLGCCLCAVPAACPSHQGRRQRSHCDP